MPISVSWDPTTPDVAVVSYKGSWNWQEHHAAIDALSHQGTAHSRPYTVIIDISESNHMPTRAFSQLGRTVQNLPQNWNHLAFFVTDNQIAQTIMTTLIRIYGQFSHEQTYLYARSYDQAIATIRDLHT